MYITKDEISKNYFSRFKIIEIDGQPWEVQNVDALSTEGIIRVLLKEYYNNTIEKEIKKEKEEEENKVVIDENQPYISGSKLVYPYDEIEYIINNAEGGVWVLDSTKAKIINQTSTAVLVAITTGRSGTFELIYKRDNKENITLEVVINSL